MSKTTAPKPIAPAGGSAWRHYQSKEVLGAAGSAGLIGEVFSVPVDGLPDVLCEVEVPADPAKRPRQRMPLGEEGDDVYEMAACSGRSRRFLIDPLHGAAFCDLFSFKVEVVEGRESQSTTFRVDSRSAQILLKGQSQARGLPYCRCHLFCQAPPQPLPSLQGPAERLLGMLAPCVRGWELGATSDLPSVLVSGPRGCGKRVLWHSVCERLGLHLFEMNCTALAAEGLGSLEARLSEASAQAAGVSPCVLCLRRLHALSSSGATMSPAATLLQQRRIEDFLQSALQKARTSPAVGGKSPLVLLAGSCESLDDLGGPIRQSFSQELAVPRPNEVARKFAISELLKRVDTTPNSVVVMNGMSDASEKNTEPTVITAITKLTAGLSYSDLRSVCAELAMNKSALSSLEATATASSEVQQAVEQAVKRLQGGSKVAVTLASKIQWADVGGLQDAKEEIMNCITLPLSQGQMFEGQKVRSGVLLFGPPGTGKTLLAKAVATECKVHFLSVKGPELLSMYIGESEKNVRSLFQSARDLAPCVLFFDELDSLAPARGRGSDSGGVMDRVVSQLVTELDTMPSTVFMVGATNRPDLLDRSLLRPGRLDRMVYLGVAADKLPLLSAITRKFVLEAAAPANGTKRASNLLAAVAEACPPNLTGADVSVLCADAYGIAQREHISKLHEAADLLQTPISTFLLFLDALELHLTDALRGPRTYDAFWKMSASHGIALVQLFPAVSDEAEPGRASALQLYGAEAQESFVIATVSGSHGPGRGFAVACCSEENFEDLSRRWLAHARPQGSDAATLKMLSGFDLLHPLQVQVGLRHFQQALSNLQPSDLQRYEQLRAEPSSKPGEVVDNELLEAEATEAKARRFAGLTWDVGGVPPPDFVIEPDESGALCRAQLSVFSKGIKDPVVARAEDLSVKCSRSVGMNFQVERSQDESSGPVHPCVAICVGMLLIVIGPFFIWHTEGDYVKILQVLDDALKDVKEPCSAMCTNCDFSKVKDGDLIYLAGPFHNLKTLTDVRKEGGFNIKELEPAVSGQEAAAAYSWSIEMFQFEQDVDTSQSVTLKADECKAAAFGVVTGEAKSRVCCDSIDAPGRKKFERLYVGRTNDARCHPARKRTHAESFLQEIDDVGLQFGNSTEGVLPELDKRRRLRDGKPAEPDIHCSYPCKHWTGRWADREFPTKPSAWTWLPYDLLQIDEVQWIEGAPAGNIPRLPFTGAYSNVKGGPGVTGGVTLGGVTLQLFKPEAGDELFQTMLGGTSSVSLRAVRLSVAESARGLPKLSLKRRTSSAILDRAGGDAGLQALGKDPIQSTFETQYKIEYRGYRRAAKWTSRETSYSRSDTCLVSSPMATGNLAAPQGGDLRI
eukprot:s518_g30.t1